MSPDTILVIEDDEADAILLENALKLAGLSNPVILLPDGEAGVDFLVQRAELARHGGPLLLPLVVLVDLKMPKLNGFEVLEQLRHIPELASLVAIVLTSSDEESDVLLAYELGARSYLVKPPSPADLNALIKTVTAMPSPEWLEFNPLPGKGRKLRNEAEKRNQETGVGVKEN